MRATRLLLGGGAVHPNAFKGGRKPGQLFAKSVGQLNAHEAACLLCGTATFSLTLTLWYRKYFVIAESSWIDTNYDFSYPYQRDWAAQYAKPYTHLRPISVA
ncbi:hypothetical protein DIPPA_02743 [Diplonema papillatum]|nr:hypothetical protein DIPPA_02743 [Diplonema papillatum]